MGALPEWLLQSTSSRVVESLVRLAARVDVHKAELRTSAMRLERDDPLILVGADLVYDFVRPGLVWITR